MALFTFNSFYQLIAICHLLSITCLMLLAICYLLYDAFYLKLAITCKNLFPYARCCTSRNFCCRHYKFCQDVCCSNKCYQVNCHMLEFGLIIWVSNHEANVDLEVLCCWLGCGGGWCAQSFLCQNQLQLILRLSCG